MSSGANRTVGVATRLAAVRRRYRRERIEFTVQSVEYPDRLAGSGGSGGSGDSWPQTLTGHHSLAAAATCQRDSPVLP